MIMKLCEIRFGMEVLFGEAVAAVAAFVRTVPGSNVPFSWFCERMTACYRGRSPLMLLLLVLDDTERVVGHLLAFIEDHYGSLVAYCYQAHLLPISDAADRTAIIREGLDRYESWARQNGCAILAMATARSERAMARRFGFQKRFTIMVRRVGD